MLTKLLYNSLRYCHYYKQSTDLEQLTKNEQLALRRAQQDEPAQIVEMASVDLQDFVMLPHGFPAHRAAMGGKIHNNGLTA